MIGYIGIPYFGIIYSASITLYSGYNAIINGYSLYIEHTSENFELKSSNAYKDFFKILSHFPLLLIYDFSAVSNQYEVKINNINLNIEKAHIKQQLQEKGEFGHKLYDVYAPSLEEKYNLLNKVIQGVLTQEEAEALKAKHIQIIFEDINYEHCIEIKNIQENDYPEDIQYCRYNETQQIIDHVIVGRSNDIEIIRHL